MTQQQIVSAPAVEVPRRAPAGAMPTGGRWNWYRDHLGVEMRRVSKLVEKVETNTWNLDRWKERQVALGLAKRDDLMLSVKAMGAEPDDEIAARAYKKKLNGIVKEAQGAAKTGKGGNRAGTAVHDLTERIDRGEPIDDVARGLPAEAAQSLRAYEHLRRVNGWQSVEIERTVECEELEVRGTFDRVDYLPELAALLGPSECQYGHRPGEHDPEDGPGGLPVVVDVKTEAEPWRNGLHIAPQLAIYSRARKMWRPTGGTVRVTFSSNEGEVEVPAGEYVPAPCVRQDVAIVVHVRDGQAVPYFVNLTAGWDAAVAAYEQAEREKAAGRKLGAAGSWFVPVPGVKFPSRTDLLTQQAVAAQYADPYRPPGLPAADGEHVAVRGDDGQVRWVPAGSVPPVEQAYPGNPSPPRFEVVNQVTVGGVTFTKHSDGICNNCAPLLAGASSTRVDGTEFGTLCVNCGGVDERSAEGGTEDPNRLARMLIEQIWKTPTVQGLAILWNMAKDRGVPWRGPVAQAADARRRQIECPQRALHSGDGKCACGWVAGLAP